MPSALQRLEQQSPGTLQGRPSGAQVPQVPELLQRAEQQREGSVHGSPSSTQVAQVIVLTSQAPEQQSPLVVQPLPMATQVPAWQWSAMQLPLQQG